MDLNGPWPWMMATERERGTHQCFGKQGALRKTTDWLAATKTYKNCGLKYTNTAQVLGLPSFGGIAW